MRSRLLAALLAAFAAVGLACHVSGDDGAAEPAPAKPKTVKSKGRVNSASSSKAVADKEGASSKIELEKATFGGGCFWCMEAVFEQVKGVKSVVSGYSGGEFPRPFYEAVATGTTGHAECIQVEYDALVVTYDDLLKVFFNAHDPTTPNRQGPDEGTEYRSIILYHNESQKKAAQKMYEKLTAARAFRAPIVTELVPLKRFYPAERYHQNYYRNHRFDPYCEEHITPKLQMMRYKQAMERAASAKSAASKE